MPLYLSNPTVKREALAKQESRRQQTEADHYVGMISAYVDEPFRDGDDFDEAPWAYRHHICAVEIWEKPLGENGKLARGSLLEIQRAMDVLGWTWVFSVRKGFKDYGRQKYWERPVGARIKLDNQAALKNGETTESPDDETDALI